MIELFFLNHQAYFCETQLYNLMMYFCFPTALQFLHAPCFFPQDPLLGFDNLNFFILGKHISITAFLFLLKHLSALATIFKYFFYHHRAYHWKIKLFYHLAWSGWNMQDFSNFQESWMLCPKGTLGFAELIILCTFYGKHARILSLLDYLLAHRNKLDIAVFHSLLSFLF